MKKKNICCLLLLAVAVGAVAQSGTKSPYSQYGVGVLADQSQGFNRGMNGVGIAMQSSNLVNTLNPASYSGVDSLTMLFDAGLSGQVTNFEEGQTRVNARNANFEYAVGSFRLHKNLGFGFGILPYSNVGYTYTQRTYLDNTNGTIVETYSGSGGLRQLFGGVGWRVAKPLSVGVNVGYLWGEYTRSISTTSTSYIYSLAKSYTASAGSYKLDFGVQYRQPLGAKDALTLGLTYGLGHKVGSVSVVPGTSASDTTFADGVSIPTSYGVGLAWQHDKKLTVGADFKMQKWGQLESPEYNAQTRLYELSKGSLMDAYSVAVGGEYVPKALSRKFLQRLRYRVGAGYATPYYKINGADGPKELSVSAGFGIPIINKYNNHSILNVSGQWVRSSAKDLITENTFRINIGITFNERWFMKWKVD